MIAVSARTSGSVITDMVNRAADILIKAAALSVPTIIVANRETGLRNSTVILIFDDQ
jgi:hypothetical protein